MKKKTVEEYLSLPYTIEVTKDTSDDPPVWFARVRELPGCATEADTFEEVGAMIEDAMRLWIEVALESSQEIPEPQEVAEFSGKFMVRMSRSLHGAVSNAAANEGVSLNAWVTCQLARAVGRAEEKQRSSTNQPVRP
jgi:predicted RNase H-like HicB family nuclease